MADEAALPDELAAMVLRVDELVRHFEEYPDPLVRGPAMELLQLVDGLHRGGLRRFCWQLPRARGSRLYAGTLHVYAPQLHSLLSHGRAREEPGGQ